MYYNIKIITKDSEFGLESQDKTIIEREMDIYFARIFGASREFISKIKPVQIKPNVELKSINEFEASKPVIKEEKPIIQNTQGIAKEPKEEINTIRIEIKEDPIIEEIKEEPVIKEPEPPQIIQEEIIQAPVVEEAEPVQEEIKEYIPETPQQDYKKIDENALQDIFSAPQTQEEAPKNIENTIDNNELEKEAEHLFSELQRQVQENNSPAAVEQKEPDTSSIPVMDDTIQLSETVEIPEISITEPKKEEPPSAYQDILNAYNEANIQQTPENNDTQVGDLGYKNAISLTEEVTGHMLQAPEENENNEPQENKQEEASKTPYISFNMFLGGFRTDDIKDEFLICSAYIKNVLNQSAFNMKYINSKLFQATGKIADTSVLDELIQKEYIKITGSDEYTQYAITPKGEEYLASKLPS